MVAVLGSSRDGAARKVKVYSLPELVEKADAIVVVKMSVAGNVHRATVLRSLKGDASSEFTVRSAGLPGEDRVSFTDGETALLFTQKEENGSRKLLGYSDQGKWPKTVAR